MNRSDFERTEALIGSVGMDRLENATVAVFGLGGVGGTVAEALTRSGVGRLFLYDADSVKPSNLNRQIIATYKTVGMPKVKAMAERLYSINPEIDLVLHHVRITPESEIPWKEFDFAIDCIDTVTSKLFLIENARQNSVEIASSMGMGNRMRPECVTITDISRTHHCPLSRVMRRELRLRGIEHLTVVFSTEEAPPIVVDTEHARHAPASSSFVPPVAGYMLAAYAVRRLVGEDA